MDTQDIIAILIVLAAATWLAKRIYDVVHSAAGDRNIGACGQCPNNRNSTEPRQVVEINQKPPTE
jgi:hypothetical protein